MLPLLRQWVATILLLDLGVAGLCWSLPGIYSGVSSGEYQDLLALVALGVGGALCLAAGLRSLRQAAHQRRFFPNR